MWSLYENGKPLEPLVFSNGKSQADIVREVLKAVKDGFKLIFIKGTPGTGKSAIALNLARKLGKTSIVVPIKSLQEQYIQDYTDKKYILKEKEFKIPKEFLKENQLPEEINKKEKLKISPILGRQNFKCKYLEENKTPLIKKEKNLKLNDIFENKDLLEKTHKDKNNSCDNDYLPCKIEIKEKNLSILKEYIKQNPNVEFSDFNSINEIRRMTVAPACPYYSPVLATEVNLKNTNKIFYKGLNNKKFVIHNKPGCPYYEQYLSYKQADVIIFNSLKYKIETIMDRKPETELEIIDECDEFLDSFSIEEQININRISYTLDSFYSNKETTKEVIDSLHRIINSIKESKYTPGEVYKIKNTPIEKLLNLILEKSEVLDTEIDEHSYFYHLQEVSKTFSNLMEETFFSIEKKDNNHLIKLVTINLKDRFKEMVDKNKLFVLMSGTIHNEEVLRNLFGLEKFKIIDAEIGFQGEIIKCKYGYEMDCSYANFQSNKITREQYLKALSKSIYLAKPPVLVHVTSFSDLPSEKEKKNYFLNNLITQEELIEEQKKDLLGERVIHFKNKKTDILFTTKCSRGIDFPGETCSSIVLTRFPYPNISSIFWRILKKTNPGDFMSFYIDKANRELLQRIYRGLRSKNDRVYLLSPDNRVLDFDFENLKN